MDESTAKTAASASALGVLVTAFLAWLAASQYPSDSDRAAEPSARKSTARSGAAVPRPQGSKKAGSFHETLALRPLREVVFGVGSERGKHDLQSLQTELEKAGPPALRCLLATVPDPTGSLGFRFDDTIDSIEQAAGAYGYVLERWRLPWHEHAERSGQKAAPEKKEQADDQEDSESPLSESSVEPAAGDPGLLVYRRAGDSRGRTAATTDLLLVFLIAETPTQGVDRLALTRSLELADKLRDTGGGKGEQVRRVNVVAPCFSGSMPSLRDALREWLGSIEKAGARTFDVEILSGTASAFDRAAFLKMINDGRFKKLKSVSFASMTHRFEKTLDAILDFLGRSVRDKDVAIFSEIDTGFGESVSDRRSGAASRTSGDRSLIHLQYPSHIAEIRRRYESQGLMKDGASNVFRATDELQAQSDAEETARDVFPNLAPAWAASSENRVLTQALRYLEDSRVKVVGIIGTDPRDTVFLARLINRYCPDARIFTVGADLFYLDSRSIADLRGMIVGSTYPLYAANHSWTGSAARSRGWVFPSDDAQGIYNAAVVQIARLIADDQFDPADEKARETRSKTEGEHLLEYAAPIPLQRGLVLDTFQPPIWVSVVGERSLYPLDCVFDPARSDADRDYVYQSRVPDLRPGRLVIDRALAWFVCLAAASALLAALYLHRVRHALARAAPAPFRDRRAPASELATTLVRVLILAGYLYIACPALAQMVPGTIELNLATDSWRGTFRWVIVLVPVAVALAALLAPIAEFRVGRCPWRAAEALGVVFVAAVSAYIQVRHAASPRWLLSLDRSAAITGGVSAHVPVAFLMAALGAWLYAQRRIAAINESFAFTPEYNPTPSSVSGPNRAVLQQIDLHRARFDRWFLTPTHVLRLFKRKDMSWSDRASTLIALAFLFATLIDTTVFRPISWSDEGILFDLFFRLGFAVVLTLIALTFANLHSAWGDFRAVLDGLGKILGEPFERMPKNVASWLMDPDRCNAEYGHLICRQVSAVKTLLTGWNLKTEAPRSSVKWDTKQALHQLAVLDPQRAADAQTKVDKTSEIVASFRYFARALTPYWTEAGVAVVPRSEKPDAANDAIPRTREENLIRHLEDLLALEAARWVSGALVRIWTSIGFLSLSAVTLLFAITSYPFPEQSRVMTVLGFAIAAVVVMVLRVALGSSRNEVLSRIDGTAPGRITWDSKLFSSLAAYVVPLVGLLTAVSFEMLDLFRSVLGPILRIFP